MNRLAWVIGARGLLGSSVERAVVKRPGWTLARMEPLLWNDPAEFISGARASIRSFLTAAARQQAEWNIVWAAGVAVTSSPAARFDDERAQLRQFLECLADETGAARTCGNVFFASSAGGVYAGASGPPFTENTPAVPLAPYGAFKLEMEQELRVFAEASGAAVVVGRVANLYGPGQRLDKMQGLISHLAVSRFAAKPVFIFVPLETVRDYIFVDDCAELILDTLKRMSEEKARLSSPTFITKIIASGQAVSISSLLGYYRAITKSAPRVVLGTVSAAQYQAIDLRVRSVVWPELDRRERMPLEAGFHATMMDVLSLMQSKGA